MPFDIGHMRGRWCNGVFVAYNTRPVQSKYLQADLEPSTTLRSQKTLMVQNETREYDDASVVDGVPSTTRRRTCHRGRKEGRNRGWNSEAFARTMTGRFIDPGYLAIKSRLLAVIVQNKKLT
ncbi:uncharacterized protein LOC124307281 [Neodiprion virginianus]|uniref:uncharacterized protein LOC124307281 n=1 Tax=Neodiprion virginianus TaxID=2961670 RepID=UPI001EE73DC6|nr:uncharacterized protein LOC124307281 [Neodiprion virginianus]